MTRLRFLCGLGLIVALAGTAGRADAQTDRSPWRFGVTIGGGATVGVVAEYWSDDIGVEARLGTLAFQDVSVRLAPKWRVGAWDGGEASWRVGAEWFRTGGVFAAFHGVELARVTDGGHVIGGSYNLPLFGGLLGRSGVFDDPDEGPDTEDPEEGPEVDTEDPEISTWGIGAAVGVVGTLFLGEFIYRYQPGG